MPAPMRITGKDFARFLYSIDRHCFLDDCWEWLGAKAPNGYGRFVTPTVNTSAHRFMLELMMGKLPEGYFACHSCDNRGCVNPLHLWAGTRSDNEQDCLRKGRSGNLTHPEKIPRGISHGCAKLNEQQVQEIRRIHKPRMAGILARRFGVDPATIHRIVRRQRWTHI